MARCNECIHKEICQFYNALGCKVLCQECGFFINKADVVPKSEVDRLVDKWIGEENLTQDAMVLRLIEALQDEAKRYERYYFNHEYDKLIAEAKQEVAREIFEEIEEMLNMQAKIVCQTRAKHEETDKILLSFIAQLDGRLYSLRVVEEHIAELKKKYTESEDI